MQTLSLLRVTLCAGMVLATLIPAAHGNTYLAASKSSSTAPKSLLTLTPDQQAKATAIRMKLQQDVAALKDDKTMTADAKEAALQKLAHTYDSDLLAVLTPAQRAMVEKKRAIMQGHAAEVQQMAAALQKSLTAKQNKQMDDIINSTLKQLDAIRQDTKLTVSGRNAQIAALQKEAEERTKAALKPDQLAIYVKMRKMQQTVQAEDRELTAR